MSSHARNTHAKARIADDGDGITPRPDVRPAYQFVPRLADSASKGRILDFQGRLSWHSTAPSRPLRHFSTPSALIGTSPFV